MTVKVSGYLILISMDFYDLFFNFSVFSLILVSIEKIYQTVKTVFDHISKHLEACQKYSAARFCVVFAMLGNVVKHGLFCLIYYI